MDRRVRRLRGDLPSLWEMVRHPFATLNRLQGLDRLPDRRVSRSARARGRLGTPQSSIDPIRREARVQSIYRALGIYAIEETRPELYENYREMDTDPMVAAILDEFGAGAAQRDAEQKRIVWCKAPNQDIQRIVTDTLDRLKIDQWSFPIQRAMGRDGDVMFHVAASRGFGVVAIRPYEPWVVARIEDDIGRLVGFAPADEQGEPSHTANSSVPHYRVLHFHLPSRELSDRYGATSSYLWGSRIVWRQLQLMEDQVVLQRLLRRPDRLIVLMDTTGMSHDESWMTIKDYENRLHRETYLNPATDQYQSFGNPVDIAKDLVLPRGANNQTSIENFPATNQNDLLRDLDMMLTRFAAGVGFPLGFVGRGEPGAYIPGQTLARQHQPFAKRTNRLQDNFLPEITRLCEIDLAFKGLDPTREENRFTLLMTTTSPIEEIERNEVIQLKTDRLERAVSFGQTAELDLSVWVPFCLERYGGFSRDLVVKFYPQAASEELRERYADLHEDVIAEADRLVGELIPVVQDTTECRSQVHTAVLSEEQRNELKSPKGQNGKTGLYESIKGKGEDERAALVNEALKKGEPVVGAMAKMKTEPMIEKRRKSAVTRVKLVSALAGLPVPKEWEQYAD